MNYKLKANRQLEPITIFNVIKLRYATGLLVCRSLDDLVDLRSQLNYIVMKPVRNTTGKEIQVSLYVCLNW